MQTRHALLLLGVLLLTPPGPLAHAQHGFRPHRAMRPFGSDAELLHYLAELDRARPSRRPRPGRLQLVRRHHLRPAPGKRVVITGQVRDAAEPIANAGVFAFDRCTVAARRFVPLELPAEAAGGSRVRLRASFIGYRAATLEVTVRRRSATADFTLAAVPVQPLEEASVVTGGVSADFRAKDESITNTQHAGVDEGGIVKLHGDYLIVLRRGRLFTLSVRAGDLRPVAMVNAFPAGADPADWYDEMLVSGDRVIVIGYSYGRRGTEVSLFQIDEAGGLRHLSTSHLRSDDYYSSRNYAARLVEGKLVLYTPLRLDFADPLASLPAMREWRPEGEGGFERIVTPRRIYRPARSLAGNEQLTLHTITQCAVAGPRLECDATVVVGPFSRVFCVSPSAVYVWTADCLMVVSTTCPAPRRSFGFHSRARLRLP
jgi:hypothetical protein